MHPSGGPHNHLQAQWSIRRIHRTQHIVILMSKMNYSKKIQTESVKEKSAWNKALRSQVQASKSSLPVESPRTNFSGIKLGQHMCLPRKLIRDAVPKGPPPARLPWAGHVGTLCPAQAKIPDSQKVFSTNHTVVQAQWATLKFYVSVGNYWLLRFPDANKNTVSWPFYGKQSRVC